MLIKRKELLKKFNVILGSQSKGRYGLLKQINVFDFQVIPSTFEENLSKTLKPEIYVQKTCEGKIENLLETFQKTNQVWDICICTDTVCEFQGKIIEKAKTKEQAFEFLKGFSNKTHLVHSSVYVAGKKQNGEILKVNGLETTEVYFANLNEEIIQNYLMEDINWRGCAGAYSFQGAGGLLIKKVNGDYTNVVGLPLPMLDQLMEQVIKWILDEQ